MRQSLVLLPLVCLLPLLPASCAPGEADWKPPSIVTAEGAKAWYSLSPQYGLLFGPAKPDGPVALLLRDGDIVEGQDHQPVPYRAADGAAIAVTSEGGRTMLAGKTVAVSLGGDEAWPWLEKAAPQDLAALRALDLAEALTPERLALVKKVAEQNPTVGLHAGSRDAFRQVVPLFQPAWLSLSTETFEEQDFAILAACKGLRMLLLGAKEGNLEFLARLKDLRTLFLSEWDPTKTGPLPAGMAGLKTLVIFGADGMVDLAPIANATGIESLSLPMGKSVEDVSGLAKFPRLTTLNLVGCEKVTRLDALRTLKGLKWLGLPSKITQEQFAEVVRDHPGLVILEAVACEGITDLKPVQDLRHLEYLAAFTSAPSDPLTEMKGLKWLAVGFKKDTPTEQVEQQFVKLQQALPNTAIVHVAPLCLGSGWILLLAPAAAGAWWRASRRRRGCRGPVSSHA